MTPRSRYFFLLLFLRSHLHLDTQGAHLQLDTQAVKSCTVAPDWLTHTHEYLGGTFSPTNSPVPSTIPGFGDRHHPSPFQNILYKTPSCTSCTKVPPAPPPAKLPIVQDISLPTPAFVPATGAPPDGQIGSKVSDQSFFKQSCTSHPPRFNLALVSNQSFF